MTRLRLISLTLALMFVLMAVAFSPGHTPAAAAQASIPRHLSAAEARMTDAQIYADHMGVSVAEAVRRFDLQEAAGNLDAALTRQEAATFAGLWVQHTPDFRVVVLTTQNNTDALATYIQRSGLAGLVDIRPAAATLSALRQAQTEAMTAVRGLDLAVESEINVFENRVQLYVADRAGLDAALQRGAISLSPLVAVITVERMSSPAANIYGGLSLSTCTSGFGVKRTSDGVKGISTAAHCGNSQSYSGTALTFKAEKFQDTFDVQWHTAPGYTVKNWIKWWNDGSTREITSTKSRDNQAIGNYVCKYGMTTFYTCGYISSKTYAPSYVPSADATFIRVDNTGGYSPLAGPGDSGGPWFLNNGAWGVMSGIPGSDANDAIYMAVNYHSGISVSVMTAP